MKARFLLPRPVDTNAQQKQSLKQMQHNRISTRPHHIHKCSIYFALTVICYIVRTWCDRASLNGWKLSFSLSILFFNFFYIKFNKSMYIQSNVPIASFKILRTILVLKCGDDERRMTFLVSTLEMALLSRHT